jgi:hypothetical protein
MATEYRVLYSDGTSSMVVTQKYADRVAERTLSAKVQKREVGDWQDA